MRVAYIQIQTTNVRTTSASTGVRIDVISCPVVIVAGMLGRVPEAAS
jgi:hypothetical protein